MNSAAAAQNIAANASVGNCSGIAGPTKDNGKATIGSPIRLLRNPSRDLDFDPASELTQRPLRLWVESFQRFHAQALQDRERHFEMLR